MNKFFLYLFLLFSFSSLYSQAVDTRLWTSISVDKDLPKGFDLNYEIGYRLKENLMQNERIFNQVGFSYSILKSLKFDLQYRYTNKFDLNDNLENEHRFTPSLRFKEKEFGINFYVKLKYQWELNRFDNEISQTIRATFKARKKITKDYFLTLGLEPFFPIENNYIYQEKLRFIFINSYELNKRNSINLDYLYQMYLYDGSELNQNVFRLAYTFSF